MFSGFICLILFSRKFVCGLCLRPISTTLQVLEQRLKDLLAVDEEAAKREDEIKDAAPADVKKRAAAKARRGTKTTRRYSVV
eukprot:COSAG01_NODE_1714_length_9405_cov_6.727488_3_plen_82_part_00